MPKPRAVGPPPTSGPASGAPQRLRGGVLGMADIAAATMANVGPAMSFFFSFTFLATTAGEGSPLTIVAAGVAVALLGNTLAEFSRAHPSAGSFITFVGKTFGPVSAVTTALLATLGYIVAMAGVISISGGFVQITLHHYTGVDLPWIIWTLLLTGLAVVLMLRGVVVSTKWAGYFFGVEMLMLVVVSVAAIVEHRGDLSAAPFLPSHISHGFKGLAAGFPLAVYMFIGWENSAALAEETENPRRNVGRAVFSSVAIMTVSYILFAYSTLTGFGYDVARLGDSPTPFIDVAHHTLGALAFVAYLGGLTSTLGVLVAGINSQARLVFNAGREGLLPSFLGYVHPTRRTPNKAIVTFTATSLLIIGGWALGHLLGPGGGSMNPVVFFTESSTLGAILILLVYLASNIALPLYYRRYRPQEFRKVRHLILPALGTVAILVPLYYLAKPGQPAPYNWFPYAALAALLAAVGYAALLVRRDPSLAERVGSIVADAD
ncbi:APC family permease [Streptomyces griseorubiginosus]|uniref:APC family permease n=1 Tax=Streptomyces griseorubiginosus TaxID=67304 RepID=UPI00331A949C